MNMQQHWSEHKAVDPILLIVKWFLALSIAFYSAALTWMLIDRPTLVLPEPSTSVAQMSIVAKNHDIPAWHLFGKSDQAVATSAEEINAPKTRLRLSLMGVFVASDIGLSTAIIAEQGREGEFFKVGDRVQGRARLSQVYENKVILDNSGKLETLTFDDSAKLAGSIVTKSPVKKNKRKVANSPRAFKNQLKGIRTPEQFVDFAKGQLTDPAQAMKNMGLKVTDGGYVLESSASMLSRIGMKSGDKLISVNGNTLGDPEQDKLLIDDVYESGSASIVIERGSRRMTINHSF
ncbi:MAG: general secretion pathway protein C [Bermanella sp.]|jgi:general secretion pathway protein C